MDKNIGRTWKNGNGDERKVVALSSINNVKRYLIGTGRGEASPEADRMPEICSISDIDALIARETKMYEANSEFRKRQEEQRLREAKLEKDRTSLDGFEYTLSNMMRGKAIAALTKSVRHDGRIIPLRDLIRMKVKEGWRVKTSASGARRLEKDGVFLDAKAVTKIGLDYAEHLSNKTDKAEELMPNTVNNTDVAAIGTMVNDFIAALQLATPGKKVMFPWKGRITKATAMQVGLLAKRIASVFPDFTAHFNTAKKAIEIYLPAGVSLSGIAKALAHPKSVITAGSVKPTVKTFHKILLASGFKITNTESDSSLVPSTKFNYTHPDGHKVMVVSYHNRITYAVYAHKLTNDNMVLSVINTESQLKMAIARSYRAYMRNPLPAQTNQKLVGLKDVNKAALKDLNTHTASNDFTVTAVLNSDDATKMRPTKIDIKAGDKLRYLRGEAHTEFRVNNERPGYLIGNVMFDRIIKPNLK